MAGHPRGVGQEWVSHVYGTSQWAPPISTMYMYVCSVTDKAVGSFLSPVGRAKWQTRADVSNLVLVDDHSCAESQATPLLALRDALFKVRVHVVWRCACFMLCLQYETVPLTSDPKVLEGGYAMWYLTYAVTCVGVYKRRTSAPPLMGSATHPTPQAHTASGLDYPSFPEIKYAIGAWLEGRGWLAWMGGAINGAGLLC